jgi:hypothetical protein
MTFIFVKKNDIFLNKRIFNMRFGGRQLMPILLITSTLIHENYSDFLVSSVQVEVEIM